MPEEQCRICGLLFDVDPIDVSRATSDPTICIMCETAIIWQAENAMEQTHERGLTGILRDLARKSSQDGMEHRAMLKRGLTVSIEVIPSKITLRVSRRVGAPSLTEWQTCYEFLPAVYRDGLRPQPVEYVEDGCQTLSASWPPPQRLL